MLCFVYPNTSIPGRASCLSYNMCFGQQYDYSWIMTKSCVAEICDYLVFFGLKTVFTPIQLSGFNCVIHVFALS